jgi:NADPH:quinone reductase-like Zn-dependent oxidoreductase
MRRVRYHEYGDPDVLTIEEADIPAPGPGEVLIHAEAIGANFVDTKFRRGPASGAIFQRPLPGVVTGDVVGIVKAVGAGADPGLAGRRVAALAEDAFADYVVADAQWLAEVPKGIDDGMASMLPMGAPVALRALRTGRLAAGETVLVHAAAGGIGHLAVQLVVEVVSSSGV